MKLRRNTLLPLRFDASGAMIPDHGISPSQVSELLPKLASIRDAIMGTELEMLAGKLPIPAEMEPLDVGFVTLPDRLLAEYESNRNGSELGRLFQRATHLHKIVDRVVVLGIGGSYMGAIAILDSCCQPY